MEISMNLIQELEKEQFDKLAATKTIPEFGPGDTVIVNVKVVEGERTRVQAYEGVAPSCITCVSCAASRPASSKRRPSALRPSASNPSFTRFDESAGFCPALFCCRYLYEHQPRPIDRLSRPRGLC
jgi:hypothetical protein